MNLNYCTRCKEDKANTEFSKNKRRKNGLSIWCHACHSSYNKTKDKQKNCERVKLYYQKNKLKLRAKAKEYYKSEQGKNYRRQYDKKYSQTEKCRAYRRKYNKEYQAKRRSNDLNFRLINCLRARIRTALKTNSKGKKTIELLGCSIEQLKSHIESLFQPDMNWQNYGLRGWHIDHIVPCTKFDLRQISEQKKCFHYSNLQPLWAKDNITKSNKS